MKLVKWIIFICSCTYITISWKFVYRFYRLTNVRFTGQSGHDVTVQRLKRTDSQWLAPTQSSNQCSCLTAQLTSLRLRHSNVAATATHQLSLQSHRHSHTVRAIVTSHTRVYAEHRCHARKLIRNVYVLCFML